MNSNSDNSFVSMIYKNLPHFVYILLHVAFIIITIICFIEIIDKNPKSKELTIHIADEQTTTNICTGPSSDYHCSTTIFSSASKFSLEKGEYISNLELDVIEPLPENLIENTQLQVFLGFFENMQNASRFNYMRNHSTRHQNAVFGLDNLPLCCNGIVIVDGTQPFNNSVNGLLPPSSLFTTGKKDITHLLFLRPIDQFIENTDYFLLLEIFDPDGNLNVNFKAKLNYRLLADAVVST